MKKGLLFITGGVLLAMASCQNEVNTGTSDAQIDSMVNARVEELRTEMMMQNDSLINAMAIMKADSICGAKKSGSTSKPAPKPSRPSASDAVKKPIESTRPIGGAPNTPTGKNSESQKTGTPTGKNSQSQQTEGQPTGKRGIQQQK